MSEAGLISRFFEAGFALFCALSQDGTFVRVNKVWEEALGYVPEELVGRNIAEFTYKKDIEATRKAIAELSENEMVTDLINRFRCRDGGYRQLEWHVVGFGDLLYACVQDVTPFAAKSMQKMQATVDRYSKMFNSSPVVMMISNASTGRITDVNDAFIRQFRYSREEALEKTVAELHLYEDIASREEHVRLLLEQGYYKDRAAKMRNKQGERFDCLCSGILLENPDEELFFTVLTDVTGLMEEERAFRERADLFESMLNSIPEAIFYKDPAGVYLGCNPFCADILGIRKQEIVGKTDFDIFGPETARSIRDSDRKVLADRQPVRSEIWYDLGKGAKTLHESLKAPYVDAQGNVLGIIGISRDVTENKLWEKEI
ncbi:MAG TPA: PAS domain S-box protein, partial [Synergistaceae bacterium]|nr:PAS domain S-box protein [Synergistaceae bacterium]